MINWIEVIKAIFIIFLICVPFILWMCKIRYATYVGETVNILLGEEAILRRKLHELEQPTPRYPVFRSMTQMQYEYRFKKVKDKRLRYQSIDEFISKYLTWEDNWAWYKIFHAIWVAISSFLGAAAILLILSLPCEIGIEEKLTYKNWEKTKARYEMLQEPTTYEIQKAEELNHKFFNESYFLTEESVESKERINTDMLWKRFYGRVK